MPAQVKQYRDRDMTTAEFAFASAILKGLENAEAYKKANPRCKSDKAASVGASRMLQRPTVHAYISKELEKIENARRKEIEVDDLWVTKNFKDVFERCMQRAPVMEFNREERRLEQATDEAGNGIWTFDSTGANRALENIAKHIGYYEKDNAQKAPVIQIGAVQNVQNYFFDEPQSPQEQGGSISGQLTDTE